MEENQKFIKNISSLQQLLNSYLVAESIIEIRGEKKAEIEILGEKNLPPLENKDKRANDLYKTFAKLVGYRYQLLWLCKLGLDAMDKYQFSKDPSVVTSATLDTAHLQGMFQSDFSLLARINLYDHTLNVFEKGLEAASGMGRSVQLGVPMIGALYHDFGKSSKIRDKLLGTAVGKAYKAHADVSGQYIKEVLNPEYVNNLNEEANETIEMINQLVINHHPKNNKQKSDKAIMFISEADSKARKDESRKIKLKIAEEKGL